MKLEWVMSKDLIGQHGLPATQQGLTKKARSQGWQRRRAKGVKGNVYEYFIGDMPLEVRRALGAESIEPSIISCDFETEGEKHQLTAKKTQLPHYQERSSDMIHIHQYDLTASAGNGSYAVAEHPIASFSFSHEWIAIQGLHNKKLTVVPVKGDSMESTLHDGDLLLVSIVEDQQDARDGVCVLRYDDEIFVKRIQFDRQAHGYKITSDNKVYSDFYIEKAEITSDRFKVIGKVERVLQRAKTTQI